MKINLNPSTKFENRHNGPSADEISVMLDKIGAASLNELIDQTIPKSIQLEKPLDLPEAKSEAAFLKEFKKLASKNRIFKSYIGIGLL
jgi:glycine dehydrogenase